MLGASFVELGLEGCSFLCLLRYHMRQAMGFYHFLTGRTVNDANDAGRTMLDRTPPLGTHSRRVTGPLEGGMSWHAAFSDPGGGGGRGAKHLRLARPGKALRGAR